MKTKSSPGPWSLRHAFGKYELSYDDDMIADMKMSGLPEDADNARLISAAPDLLEALLVARDYTAYAQAEPADMALIDAALAKALGHDG